MSNIEGRADRSGEAGKCCSLVVDAETKYKAKNIIDTAVYRGGDAVSGSVKAGIDALGFGALLAALVAAALAAVWAGVGYWLGRSHDAKQQGCVWTPA